MMFQENSFSFFFTIFFSLDYYTPHYYVQFQSDFDRFSFSKRKKLYFQYKNKPKNKRNKA